MKLNKLAPRLATIAINRLPVLEAKAGTTERLRGNSWERIRQVVKQRDEGRCAACGRVRGDHEVDHIIPLEQGGAQGSVSDTSNLQLLCSGKGNCHDIKTQAEARARAGGVAKS